MYFLSFVSVAPELLYLHTTLHKLIVLIKSIQSSWWGGVVAREIWCKYWHLHFLVSIQSTDNSCCSTSLWDTACCGYAVSVCPPCLDPRLFGANFYKLHTTVKLGVKLYFFRLRVNLVLFYKICCLLGYTPGIQAGSIISKLLWDF